MAASKSATVARLQTRSSEVLDFDTYAPFLINQVTAYTNRMLREAFKSKKITISRWRMLAITASLGPQNIGELCELSSMEQPTVSRVVDQMERDGLVVRRSLPSDNRIVRVHVTPAGSALFKKLLPIALRIADQLTRDFTPTERAMALRVLRRMITNARD
jgi:DNA-binding MarR family transcriptional regulator